MGNCCKDDTSSQEFMYEHEDENGKGSARADQGRSKVVNRSSKHYGSYRAELTRMIIKKEEQIA